MRFNSAAGQEFRTWVLFFIGIGLAIIFAITGYPLNPWWTLIIGVFTSATIIISAAQAVLGGMQDGIRKQIEEDNRNQQISRNQQENRDSSAGGEGPTGGNRRDRTPYNPDQPHKSKKHRSPIPFKMGFGGIASIRNLRRRNTVAI